MAASNVAPERGYPSVPEFCPACGDSFESTDCPVSHDAEDTGPETDSHHDAAADAPWVY
jgi:hypothetical protein